MFFCFSGPNSRLHGGDFFQNCFLKLFFCFSGPNSRLPSVVVSFFTIADGGYTPSILYVTGLLPEPFGPGAAMEVPFFLFLLNGGPILVLMATHDAIGCVPWVCNAQTSNTNRLPIRRVDSPYMSPACCQSLKHVFFRVWGRHGGPILVLRVTHSFIGCVLWVWNDQTGNTNRLPIRRVDSPYMSPACCESLENVCFGSGAAMEVPSLY